MFTLGDVLDLAAQIERNGERVYRDALDRTGDPEMAEMLEWMADEEARHAERFSDMRSALPPNVSDPVLEELGRSMLVDIVENRSFSLEDVDFDRIEEVTELIRVMIEFEQDTLDFYKVFRDLMADVSEMGQLDDIISEEQEHIRRLQQCRGKNLACLRA
jgi:rubrerythrin